MAAGGVRNEGLWARGGRSLWLIFENRWRVIAVEIHTQVFPDGWGCKEEEIQTPAAVRLYGN